MKKGFTLIEILVVLAILGILMAALTSTFMNAPKKAQLAKCRELVSNTATVLTVMFDDRGIWPEILRNNSRLSEQGLDRETGYPLARAGMALTSDGQSKLTGLDRFGIVSPWAQDVIKKMNRDSTDETRVVPSGGTIRDHRLRCALDLDGDGVIDDAMVGGEGIRIRATAAVWCSGPDGVIERYTEGRRADDVYSWDVGKTHNVK